MTYPKTIIVINGNDRRQVDWFKESEYGQRLYVTLLISEGSFGIISKQINRTVFYANNKIISRFQLKAVPSIIRQKGRMMEVIEIVVPDVPKYKETGKRMK